MYSLLLIAQSRPDSVVVVKAILLAFVLTLCSSNVFAEDWTTTDGTKYQNVRVIRVEDDAITIIYKDGGALVPLFKLPSAIQQKYDYDPVKAKAAAEARAKDDAENAKALQHEIEVADKLKREQQIKDAAARAGQTNAAATH
jgi:hypothetical protein